MDAGLEAVTAAAQVSEKSCLVDSFEIQVG
jgi:hypothetical protein